MPVRRLSKAVLIYAIVALIQAVAIAVSEGASVSIPALVLTVILFGGLFYGQPWAWLILLVMNTLALLALIGALAGSGNLQVANVIILGVTTIAMEAVLLSPAMRRHVASRGLRLAPRPRV